MLCDIVDLLHEQKKRCFVTFLVFQKLVREQEARIIAAQQPQEKQEDTA